VSPLDDRTLSMRERQIMDAVFRLQPATVREVRAELPSPPTANAVRTMLGNLVDKGYLTRRRDGRAARYATTERTTTAARSALRRLLRVFFGGSLEKAVAMHLADPSASLSPEEIESIRAMLRDADRPREGRPR
jgi:BlaI family penicillinase repressor